MELPDLFGFSNHYLVGKGVCIHCAVPIPGTKLMYPRCDACNAGYRTLYHERIEAGLCPRCNDSLASGYKLCARHLEAKRGGNPKKVRVTAPAIQWGFDQVHAKHMRIVAEADKLLSDLWAEAGHGADDTLLEFVFEAEADRDDALDALFHESGWSAGEYAEAASDTMVIGDGRVVKKAVGVLIRRAA